MQKRSEQEIMRNWKTNDSPFVSICCITYNHEPYIKEAIDSFLEQETNFSFEIIIRDDFSTDKTAEIIRDYVGRYPLLIKPIYEKENQYSKGIKPDPVVFKKAVGKYIAFCEGDDFWTDPLKLQKQVDFLEKNKDYIVSGHDAFIVDENGKHLKDSKLPAMYKKDFESEDLILGKSFILTMSMVFRNVLPKKFPEEFSMVVNGDTFLISMLGHYGKSKYHTDIKPACYRVHSGGIWSLLSTQEKSDSLLNTFFWIYRYNTRISENKYTELSRLRYNELAISRMKTGFIIKSLLKRIYVHYLIIAKKSLNKFKHLFRNNL